MKFWKKIKDRLREWDDRLLLNYPVLWESRLLIALPVLLLLFLLFFLLVLAIPVDFDKPKLGVVSIMGLTNTPQVLFFIFALITGIGFLLWFFFQARHNYWLEYGSAEIKRYALKKNIIIFLIFIGCVLTAYVPPLYLSRKVAEKYQSAKLVKSLRGHTQGLIYKLTDEEKYLSDFKDTLRPNLLEYFRKPIAKRDSNQVLYRLESIEKRFENLDHSLLIHQIEKTIRSSRYDAKNIETIENEIEKLINRVYFTRRSLEFYLYTDYPAFYRHVLINFFHPEDTQEFKPFKSDSYRSHWLVFSLFFIPFLVHFLFLYYQFFGFRAFIHMCLEILLVFTLLSGLDVLESSSGWMSSLPYNWQIFARFSIMSAVLLAKAFLLLRPALSSYSSGKKELNFTSAILPLVVVAFRYLIFAFSGFYYLITNNPFYIRFYGPPTGILQTAICYFLLGTAFLNLLYRLFLLPIKTE